VNCHCKLEENPVGDVEPMQLVVQYLTKTAIKLPSAGDNTRSSIQHPLYCPWCTGHGGVTVVHSRVNDSIDERGQRVRVQRPPDTPELTKWVNSSPRRHERRDDRRSDPGKCPGHTELSDHILKRLMMVIKEKGAHNEFRLD